MTDYAAQKSIARTLDTAAARAEFVNQRPATGKQCWFLASLMVKAGDDADDWMLNQNQVLTCKLASELIDDYLAAA